MCPTASHAWRKNGRLNLRYPESMAGQFERMLGILKYSPVEFSYDLNSHEWIRVGCITFMFDGRGKLWGVASKCPQVPVAEDT